MRGGQLGVVGRVEQSLDRDVAERRVGQVRVAVGHRQLGGLEPEVDPARVAARRPARTRREPRRLELAEDPEELEGDDPRAVRRMGRDAYPR